MALRACCAVSATVDTVRGAIGAHTIEGVLKLRACSGALTVAGANVRTYARLAQTARDRGGNQTITDWHVFEVTAVVIRSIKPGIVVRRF